MKPSSLDYNTTNSSESFTNFVSTNLQTFYMKMNIVNYINNT